jgi:hypothetical protein
MRISNKQLSLRYHAFEMWLNTRKNSERIFILLLGCAVIYLFWYLFLEKDVVQTRRSVNQQLEAQQKQLTIFQREITHVTKEGVKTAERQKLTAEQLKNNPLPVIEYATSGDNDQIIKAILLPQNNIKFISLKTTPVTAPVKTPNDKSPAVNMKNTLEMAFNSNYFATIAYLTQLEKLPWCLSWDNLNYKVGKYPDATVVINLHIVNN